MKKFIFNFVLLIGIAHATPAMIAKQRAEEAARRQVETRATIAVAGEARAVAERDARGDHCDKIKRGLIGGPEDKDCGNLAAAVDGLHIKLDGAKNYTAALLQAAGAGSRDAQLSAHEKLTQMNIAIATPLADILWRVLNNLRVNGGGLTQYDYDNGGGPVAAGSDLATNVGWLAVFNANLDNAGGASSAKVAMRKDLLIALWVLGTLKAADLQKVNLAHAGGGAGPWNVADLVAPIANNLWVTDVIAFARILEANIPDAVAGGWANLNLLNNGGRLIRVPAVGGTGRFTVAGVDFARAAAALGVLLGH